MDLATKKSRSFVKNDLTFKWTHIKPYFDNLKERKIDGLTSLKKWLKDRSELSAVLEEEFAWRYIQMNIDTTNKAYQEDFQFFVQEINPKISPFEDALNKKLFNSEFKKELSGDGYPILLRNVANQIELFREENIPLFTQLEEKSQQYGAIAAKMSITFQGEEYTLQQAAKFLKSPERTIRKEVFELITEERAKEIDALNQLYDELIDLRQEVAKNAGFDNYQDYMFKAMGRFDYNPEDCYKFHASVAQNLVPKVNKLMVERKEKLAVATLKPYDTNVDPENKPPLKPFEGGAELLKKTKACFAEIDPFFSECIEKMEQLKHLDLESKKGKAPGGFNYPLYESGLPFIYMNAVGSFRDVTTMVHEGGHAIHSVLSHPLELVEFKSLTSEIAELASMSMELISMDHWEAFFDDADELKRAKRDQLHDILQTLPWVATIDKFQHWVYTHQNHTVEERTKAWEEITTEFSSREIDWSDYPQAKKNQWQRQLHLYEVPFYYIEYGFAQLGAIAIWKNYRENPKKTLEQYKAALSLGYTKSISEVYQTAGIKFDFSDEYVAELSDFVFEEIKKIN